MSKHQVVNLRQPRPSGLGFGNADALDGWEEKAERVREEAKRRGFSYVVAPLCSVRANDGTILREGDEVMLSHFKGGERPAWKLLQQLIDRGHVLEVYAVAGPPPDAA